MGHEDVDRVDAADQARSPPNRTVLMVEHNMSVVAGICRHASPCCSAARSSPKGRTRRSRGIPQVIEAYMGTGACADAATDGGASCCLRQRPARLVRRVAHPARRRLRRCAAGEVVTLLGRNGAGKTTTLKSIIGLVGRRTGSIMVERRRDRSAGRRTGSRGSASATVPEERGIFASLSVRGEPACCRRSVRRRRHERRRDLRACSRTCSERRAQPGHASCRAASSRCWRSARILRTGARAAAARRDHRRAWRR